MPHRRATKRMSRRSLRRPSLHHLLFICLLPHPVATTSLKASVPSAPLTHPIPPASTSDASPSWSISSPESSFARFMRPLYGWLKRTFAHNPVTTATGLLNSTLKQYTRPLALLPASIDTLSPEEREELRRRLIPIIRAMCTSDYPLVASVRELGTTIQELEHHLLTLETLIAHVTQHPHDDTHAYRETAPPLIEEIHQTTMLFRCILELVMATDEYQREINQKRWHQCIGDANGTEFLPYRSRATFAPPHHT